MQGWSCCLIYIQDTLCNKDLRNEKRSEKMRQDEQKAEEESTENESRDEPSYYGICVNKTNSEKCTNYSFFVKLSFLNHTQKVRKCAFDFIMLRRKPRLNVETC